MVPHLDPDALILSASVACPAAMTRQGGPFQGDDGPSVVKPRPETQYLHRDLQEQRVWAQRDILQASLREGVTFQVSQRSSLLPVRWAPLHSVLCVV